MSKNKSKTPSKKLASKAKASDKKVSTKSVAKKGSTPKKAPKTADKKSSGLSAIGKLVAKVTGVKPSAKASPAKNSKPVKAAPLAKGKGATPVAAVKGKAVKGTPVPAVASVQPLASGKALSKAAAKAVAKASGKSTAVRGNSPDMCREIACELVSTTAGYCRLHYIKNWKKIKRKEIILREKKLNQYIEELVAKYPDKYIEAIRADLSDQKAFDKVILDLEIDENLDDFEGDGDDDAVVESVKSGRADFDDDGDF